jgi:hypothetical protein
MRLPGTDGFVKKNFVDRINRIYWIFFWLSACPPSRAATSAIGCVSGNAGRAQARRAGMKAKNFNRLRRMKK